MKQNGPSEPVRFLLLLKNFLNSGIGIRNTKIYFIRTFIYIGCFVNHYNFLKTL